MKLLSVALVSFITAALTLQATLKNGFLGFDDTYNRDFPVKNLYNCSYAGLSCGCFFINNQGGCSISCRPTVYKVLYNQTSCPKLNNFILAGFDHYQ